MIALTTDLLATFTRGTGCELDAASQLGIRMNMEKLPYYHNGAWNV
jgi:hypothetical protein